MLQPKRRKYRKEQKGRNTGVATRGSSVAFGDFGLKAVGRGRLTARQIESARRAMTRHIKRGGRIWISDAGAAGAAAAAAAAAAGPARYELTGVISHMGRSTGSGHYVAHLRKGGAWYLFNDAKVAVSQDPPLDLGYLYMYTRAADAPRAGPQ